MNRRNWVLYVLQCADGTLYTGITTDVSRRIREHNTCQSKASKYVWSRRPAKLLGCWSHQTRSEASKAEYRFKRLTRKKKLELLGSLGGGDNSLGPAQVTIGDVVGPSTADDDLRHAKVGVVRHPS